MAKKKFKVHLDPKEINDLILALNGYADTLNSRSERFVKRLAEVGIPIIDKRIAMSQGDSDPSHYTHIEIRSFGSYSQATLVVEGKDLLFIEFGAGVHFNTPVGTSPHPKGAERGYTIGSYGHGLGGNDYWYYKAEGGESVRSHGTEATMPVYSAYLEMKDKMIQIAKEVFST